MKFNMKLSLIGLLVASGSAMAGIGQTIMPNFHYLYVDFATSTTAGHNTYDLDGGAKYMLLALNGNACYDITIEGSSAVSNPDVIYKISTSSGEQTLDDDGPSGSLKPRALLWITAPTYLKVKAYNSGSNGVDFMVYSYIHSSVTTAADCGNVNTTRPFYNGATNSIVRGPTTAD